MNKPNYGGVTVIPENIVAIVRGEMRANPDATPREIADATGMTIEYVTRCLGVIAAKPRAMATETRAREFVKEARTANREQVKTRHFDRVLTPDVRAAVRASIQAYKKDEAAS